MKILFVATPNSIGHHKSYFMGLTERMENYALVTERFCPDINCKQYYDDNLDFGTKSFSEYLKILSFIRNACIKEQPDLIHIQCGDNFYRFFGLGLNHLGCNKVVMTFHHMTRNKIKDISIRNIFRNISVGVVHTKSIKQMLQSMNIKNVVHIEYPQFNHMNIINSDKAKDFFDLDHSVLCLAAIGSTRDDKGLDILLQSLQKVREPFQLLIAGSEGAIKKETIKNLTVSYKSRVVTYIKYLSEEELSMAMNAADIIVLPYRKCFDGASGPLGEGVALNKMIIGSNHGSLGKIIKDNHLGFTFESEKVSDLTKTIDFALNSDWKIDDRYVAYKNKLDPEIFRKAYSVLFETVCREDLLESGSTLR